MAVTQPFAPGTAHAVADLLQPALQEAMRNDSQGVHGPWSEVAAVLRALDIALRLRNPNAISELARVAARLFTKMFLSAGSAAGERNLAGPLLVALLNPGAMTRSHRLEALAAFVGRDDAPAKVRLFQAAALLPRLAPDLFHERDLEDTKKLVSSTLDRSELAAVLDAFSREVAVPHNLSAREERAMSRFFTRRMMRRLPPLSDGRAIVRAASRLLGLSTRQADRLFGAQHQKAARARRGHKPS